MHAKRPEDSCMHFGAGAPGSARFFLPSEPSHGARGSCGFGAPRCCLALGLQLLVLPSSEFIGAPALHVGIEHFQGPTAGVDLVVMGKIGKAFEDAEQILVPESFPGEGGYGMKTPRSHAGSE